jgi:hypothetical protein
MEKSFNGIVYSFQNDNLNDLIEPNVIQVLEAIKSWRRKHNSTNINFSLKEVRKAKHSSKFGVVDAVYVRFSLEGEGESVREYIASIMQSLRDVDRCRYDFQANVDADIECVIDFNYFAGEVF